MAPRGSVWFFSAGSPIVVKFLHHAKLGVVVGKGIDRMKSHLPLCLRGLVWGLVS